MPLYAHECAGCGARVEEIAPVDVRVVRCGSCGGDATRVPSVSTARTPLAWGDRDGRARFSRHLQSHGATREYADHHADGCQRRWRDRQVGNGSHR